MRQFHPPGFRPPGLGSSDTNAFHKRLEKETDLIGQDWRIFLQFEEYLEIILKTRRQFHKILTIQSNLYNFYFINSQIFHFLHYHTFTI